MASLDFINDCKHGADGTGNRLGTIQIDNDSVFITNSDNLKEFTVDMGCLVNGNIIGSIYIKNLKATFIGLDDNLTFEEKEVHAKVGIKYSNNRTEELYLGKYIVERPTKQETINEYTIDGYDMLYKNIDKPYVCNIDYENQVTLSDLYEDVCNQLELTPDSLEFLNDDIPISSNPFTNNETNRTVLQTIAKISCSFIVIDNELDIIYLSWVSDNTNPDYIFEQSDYASLTGGEIVYGEVNAVTIKNGQIDSENVTMTDDESIAEYGEHSIIISEDYILYSSDLRQMALERIFERLDGFKYVDCKLIAYYGKPFLNIGDKIRVITDSGYFDTYVFNHKFKYDGTFYSELDCSALTSQEIKQEQNISLTDKLRNTEIIVNKQSGEIRSLTQTTEGINDNLNNNYYNISMVNEIVQTAQTGVTNTFSEAGGNNVFRNTGLWFEETTSDSLNLNNNHYEYWVGNVKRNSNDNATNYCSMLLQNGTLYQEQEVPNGHYSVSFYYQKLNPLAQASVIINDYEYQLDSVDVKLFYTGEQDSTTLEYITQPVIVTSKKIKIEFMCDIDDAVEIYDLMCNKGDVKLAYSQNYNETTTDTVNISKGITITSTNIDVVFKANANGIRLYTIGGVLKTKFTDKGLVTKEAIVEDEAQICKTLVQEVGEQTWLTRM